MQDSSLSRRGFLSLGALGLTLPQLWSLRENPARAETPAAGFGRAKSCIVLFAWGGMSHIDTWDLKPQAPGTIRSVFQPIATRTAGLTVCKHLPLLAQQTHRMAIVRSVHHNAPSHRSAAYWNLTGHEPPNLGGNWEATRQDWPCLGSLVFEALAQRNPALRQQVLPAAMCVPYSLYDGGHANGQDAGFLGLAYDPAIVRPREGTPWPGKSPNSGNIDLNLLDGVDQHRLVQRRSLLQNLDLTVPARAENTVTVQGHRERAFDMLLSPPVRQAFDLETESPELRQKYGMHLCGQSMLMARKLTAAGVPLVTVYCAAGDLDGSAGAHWDTHGDGFNRLKNQMLPPLDQASAALLDDLDARGQLDETLVVWLTEFGRTPQVDGAGGRNHYPGVYTVAFAGAGIRGGQVYGSSDADGALPHDNPCGPPDLHATIFHALGIDPHHLIRDLNGRPLAICDGKNLPLFG